MEGGGHQAAGGGDVSRNLKRRLHIVERVCATTWLLDDHYYNRPNPSGQAKRNVQRHPGVLRHVVYDRDESTTHPGTNCLWVVERRTSKGWELIEVCKSVDQRDRVLALTPGKTRFLRFVRWRVCK